MVTLEQHLKDQIKTEFNSIKAFCVKTSIPYMTVSNVLKRGIANSSFATIQKICDGLDISIPFLLITYKIRTQESVTSDEVQESIYVSALTSQRYFKSHKENISVEDIDLIVSFWTALTGAFLNSNKISPQILRDELESLILRHEE